MAAAIVCAALSKRHASGVLGLDGVTLEVPRGAAMAMLGQNEAGKSRCWRRPPAYGETRSRSFPRSIW